MNRICKERGIMQLDLAIAVGVDQKTIANIEKARKATSISVAVVIARELGVGLKELVGEGKRPQFDLAAAFLSIGPVGNYNTSYY